MAGVAYFKIYLDAKREYRWRFTASNGKIIAVSSESYVRKADCEQQTIPDGTVRDRRAQARAAQIVRDRSSPRRRLA